MGAREFFQSIQWRATLQVAAIRIAVAAILWSVIMVIFGGIAVTGLLTQILAFLIFLIACVAVALPAIGLARANVPFAGFFALPAWLVVIGDPLVKLLHAKRPELVPVDEFKFFNPPVLAVFLTDEQSLSEASEISDIIDVQRRASSAGGAAAPESVGFRYVDVEEIDVGTPEERLSRANDLWNTRDAGAQNKAFSIYERLTVDGVELTEPYEILYGILTRIDPVGNSEKVLSLSRRLVELERDDEDSWQRLESALFMHGKACWDKEENKRAFESFLEGLQVFSRRGQVLTQQSPLAARVAFLACRVFAKDALEKGNTDLGVRFFDWCEVAGVEPNSNISVEDARS